MVKKILADVFEKLESVIRKKMSVKLFYSVEIIIKHHLQLIISTFLVLYRVFTIV